MLSVMLVLFLLSGVNSDDTLQQLHVLFRHGDRTPDIASLYPNDPYKDESLYYPEGFGALTLLGKLQELKIGKALRKTYCNFLDEIYTPNVLYARSTDYARTKMSLSLVLAGLFPPVRSQKITQSLNWQPIPYIYEPMSRDWLLGNPLFNKCKSYLELFRKAVESEEIQDFFIDNMDVIKYIKEHSGMATVGNPQLYGLYFGLYAEEHTNHTLPEWTKHVYPTFLEYTAVLQYELQTYTDLMIQYTAGPLIKKILNDSIAAMNRTLMPKERKIFLYSGHEYNIAHVLRALKLYRPHIPPYASYIVFEVHNINGHYGIKVIYQDYSNSTPAAYKIPGCSALVCPIEELVHLTKDIMPDPYQTC